MHHGWLCSARRPGGSVQWGFLAILGVWACIAQSVEAQWTATGSMEQARYAHSAAVLADGRVLVAGGVFEDAVLDSAEVYAPSTGTWSTGGFMPEGRAMFPAARLASGKVLISGGTPIAFFSGFAGDWEPLTTAALFNPVSNTWSPTGSMTIPRSWHTLTVLSSGKVLAVGYDAACELYNPATGTWSMTGPLAVARAGHAAVLLPGGKVLVIGGANPPGSVVATSSCETYDAASGSWSATGSLSKGRTQLAAALLPSGKVMAIGGYRPAEGPTASVEIWDPSTGTWSAGPPMAATRQDHQATVLADGRVLVTGGIGVSAKLAWTTSEIYDPAAGTWLPSEDLTASRMYHSASKLADGSVLLAGGWEHDTAERHTFGGGTTSPPPGGDSGSTPPSDGAGSAPHLDPDPTIPPVVGTPSSPATESSGSSGGSSKKKRRGLDCFFSAISAGSTPAGSGRLLLLVLMGGAMLAWTSSLRSS